MQKISYAGCFGLYPAISLQLNLKMCTAAKNCEKLFLKLFLGGGSRSFKVIDVNKSKKPVASPCYDKQHVCTYMQTVFTLHEPIGEK